MSGDLYLGKILGIPFRLHWSWFLAVFLIVWTLSVGFFPMTLPEYHGDRTLFWGLGLAAALGLFLSVILHEMGHAVVARRFGIDVRGIRLFVFGGIAELGSDPKKPRQEILIALAGPAVTLVLIVLFGLGLSAVVSLGGIGLRADGAVIRLEGGSLIEAGSAALLGYLAYINALLLIFNLIPAFPLDGGRVLRGIVWAVTGSYLNATRTAAAVGIGFSYVLFIVGLLASIGGNLMGGLWFFFLGMFLQNAAQSSIAYAQLQQLIGGVKVADVMMRNPICVEGRCSLREVIDNYFLRYPFKAYPVLNEGQFIGILTLRDVQKVDQQEWDSVSAGDLVGRQESLPVLNPSDSVLRAMRTLALSDASRLAVVDKGAMVGLLCARDIMDHVEIRAGLSSVPGTPWGSPGSSQSNERDSVVQTSAGR